MENKELLIGIDIGSEKVQIAYYDDAQFEPVSLEKTVSYSNDTQVLDECFQLIQEELGTCDIGKLTICMEEYTRKRGDEIRELAAEHGISDNDIYVQSYRLSYLYYVLNQKSEFWVNDVGLFDYGNKGLIYRQIAVDRGRTPYIVGIIEKDYTDMMLYEDESNNRKEYILENIAENAIHKQIISTLYITGKGFEGDWADEALKKLCRGRRVFKGQNLYVKGACYTSKKYSGTGKMPEFIYIDDDMISVHVSTGVYVNASTQELILAKAGTLWYEADSSIHIIPDSENELRINITNVLTRQKVTHIVPLDFVGHERLDMKTRLRVRVRFQDINRCIITISDEGFGDICRTSRKMYEKIIDTSAF